MIRLRRPPAHAGMFPPLLWFTRFGGLRPAFTGNDEWGRHTICFGVPGLAHVVIPWRRCTCEDMRDFACTFPSCPYLAMAPGNPCMTHDRIFWDAETEAHPTIHERTL